jgi:hypothetical protein
MNSYDHLSGMSRFRVLDEIEDLRLIAVRGELGWV